MIGTIEDVEGFELASVTDFWRRWYSPSNAILVLVGNFEEAEALERVQHWFSDVPPRPAAERVSKDFEGPRDPTDLPAREGVVFDEVPDRTRFLTWAIPGVSHADSEALEVLSWVLSGGRGTRLEDALYYERNLTTDATAYAWASDLDGSFIVEATTNKKRTTAVDRVTRRVIDSLVDEPPTALELDRAKKSIYAGLADSMEMPEGRAEQLAECMRITGEPNCLESRWARVEAVTAEDVQRVAATWLAEANQVGLTVLPHEARGFDADATVVELP